MKKENIFAQDLKKRVANQQALENKLKNISPTKKVDLHVTIPVATKDKLVALAEKEHRSIAVMLEILIEQASNNN